MSAFGHHFLIGLQPEPRLSEHDRRLLGELRPAGVVLFGGNFREGAPYEVWLEELERLLAGVRSLVGRERILVGVDHEGGRVVRAPAPVTRFAPPRQWAAEAAEVGRAMGRELRSLGINLDFAPVVDVDSNPANPIIGERSFGRTPGEVVAPARAFIRALQAEGVLACLKHFPGHGDTVTDSHEELPRVEASQPVLRGRELAPFAALCEEVQLVMTAHVLFSAIDPDHPATLSRRLIGETLREELGFRGVVVTDDLGMGAVSDLYHRPGAAVATLRAGCDLLLVCAQLTDTSRAMDLARDLRRGREAGEIGEPRLQESRARIDGLLARAVHHPVRPLPWERLASHRGAGPLAR